ncbi:MAG: cupin domain-containing protein [Chloroflexota bacterium]
MTRGADSLVDFTLVPAPATAPQTHGEDEAFSDLDGRATFLMADRSISAAAGYFLLVPGGTLHQIRNKESAPLEVLAIVSPGGIEAYFRDLADAIASAGTTDRNALGGIMRRVEKRHDVFVPLPPNASPGEGPRSWRQTGDRLSAVNRRAA